MKYWLTVRYGASDSRTYTIDAKNDDEFRKIAIARYGREIIDSHNHLWGTPIQKEGATHEVMGKTYHTFIGDLHYTGKRWYWNFGKWGQFEVDPATGGKMDRYIEGYTVKYTTKSGSPVTKQLKYEGIEFTRYALMTYDSYKDAKRIFTIYKSGKKMGTLTLAPTGKWVWTSASGTKYYVGLNGYITSQKR